MIALWTPILGIGKSTLWGWLPYGIGRWLWILASGLVSGVLLWILRERLQGHPGTTAARVERFWSWMQHRTVLVGFCALAILQQWQLHFKFGHLGYGTPWLATASLLAGGLALWRVRDDRFRLPIAAGIHLVVFASEILQFPIDPLRSDMLYTLRLGVEHWMQGKSPYDFYDVPWGKSIMPYLPGTFFPHVPAGILGIDLRWGQWILRAICFALVARSLRKSSEASPVATASPLLILSPYWLGRHDLYFDSFTLLLIADRVFPVWRWIWVPLLVVTRQWAWVLAPFLWLALPTHRQRLASLGWGIALVFIIAAILSPVTELKQFIHIVFQFQSTFHRDYTGDYGLTFAPLFLAAGKGTWLQPIQGAACLAFLIVGILGLRMKKTPAEHPDRDRAKLLEDLALMAWVSFLMFNAHSWLYCWLSVSWWAGMGTLSGPKQNGASARSFWAQQDSLGVEAI